MPTQTTFLADMPARPLCRACGNPLPADLRKGSAYCDDRCRQKGYRHRKGQPRLPKPYRGIFTP